MWRQVLHPAAGTRGLAVVLSTFLLCLGLSATEAQQEEPGPADAQIRALISQLGDVNFAERERATKELIRLGAGAVDAVREGCSHSDREIRYRCERILALIQHLDRQRRIEAFLAGDAAAAAELPGWSRFAKAVGEDRPARELFVEMIRSEWALLEQLENDPKRMGPALTRRCEQLYQAMRVSRSPITVGNVAALLLAATDSTVEVSAATSQRIGSFCGQTGIRATLQAEPNGPFRKMLANWIGIQKSGSANCWIVLSLAMQYDMKEGIVPAERILNGGKAFAEGLCPADQLVAKVPTLGAHTYQFAIFALAKLGGKQHLPLLERFLDKKTVCSTQTVNNAKYESQLRDVALAAVIHLHGQDPRQFGFTRLQPNTHTLFNSGSTSFQNDAERNAAAKKWKTFLDKQKAGE